MGRVEGKVAFITGAARGQGRSHALKLAAEGADIIAVDICRNIDSARYDLGTPEELADTAKQIEALDRRVVTAEADGRDAGIRVNTVNPSIADTDMVQNSATYDLFMPHLDDPTREQASEVFATLNPFPVPWVDAADVTNAVMFLASEEGRYITGLELKIDAGFCLA
jgi:NAD(P)-dependent dehydrogenase (short-subunit alcohol dehydrogenase family)